MSISRRECLAGAGGFLGAAWSELHSQALAAPLSSGDLRRFDRRPWESAKEESLRAIRGAISTARLDLPYGPRPGRKDNVLFTPTYPHYGAEDRGRMRAAYRSRGYTHWAIGPVSRRRPLYHDQYPPAAFDSIAEPGKYTDLLTELWHAGQVPVYFALPDTPDFMNQAGWDWAAVERDLTPIYTSAPWQALVRVVVLAWEPDVAAAEWQRGVRWLARARDPVTQEEVDLRGKLAGYGDGGTVAPKRHNPSQGNRLPETSW